MKNLKQKFKKLALKAAAIADGKKAENITLYELDKNSSLAYYVMIVTVESPAQMEAVEDGISAGLKKDGVYLLHRDGLKSRSWKVLDYGGCIIHVFETETRVFYSLDKIYHGAKSVDWSVPAAPKKSSAPSGTKKSGK